MADLPVYEPLPTGHYPCAACRDVIGVYEPALIVLRGGERVDGSPLALDDPGSLVAMYHRDCAVPAPPAYGS